MAQVARACTSAAGGDPRTPRRLSVQFRGMGFPEQEMTITGSEREGGDGPTVVCMIAEQGGNQIIRNAEAELDAPEKPRSSFSSRDAAGRTSARFKPARRAPPRQIFILRKLVEAHVALDQPVASKWLAEQDDVPWGPSTVRAELARLQELGLLEHPHTSGGACAHGHRLPALRSRAAEPGPLARAAQALRADRDAPPG